MASLSLLLLFCWCGKVNAELDSSAKTVVIISASNSPVYEQAIVALKKQLNENQLLLTHTFHHTTLESLINNHNPSSQWQQADLIVSIGSSAAKYVINNINDVPIFCSFITRNAFNAISTMRKSKNPLSAIFMDQPLPRLIKLSTLLQRGQSPFKIGMLTHSSLSAYDSAVSHQFSNNNVEIKSTTLSINESPIKKIEPLMKASDVFIVRPNISFYNRLLAKLVLQLSMRHKTPVIGFSKSYTNAGALISLHSSPADIGIDTANNISRWLLSDTPILAAPKYGQQYSIIVNQHVAKRQNIIVTSEDLHSKLQSLEENNMFDDINAKAKKPNDK